MQVGNIEIIEAESDFTKIHRSIILNDDIDCLTLGIYVKLMTLGKKWNLNINGLVNYLGISDNKIRNSIKILERMGYITRYAIKGDGGKFLGWNYKIYSIPTNEVTQAGKRTCQKTDTPLNGQDRKRTRPRTVMTENGVDNNNRLNIYIDLNNNIDSNKEDKDKSLSKKDESSLSLFNSLDNSLDTSFMPMSSSSPDKGKRAQSNKVVTKNEIDYDYISKQWKEICYMLPQPRCITPKIKQQIKKLLKDNEATIDDMILCFKIIASSNFCKNTDGTNRNGWKMKFLWFINDTNGCFQGLLDGKYSFKGNDKIEYERLINESKNISQQENTIVEEKNISKWQQV